ncbi:IS3 family transposase [Parasedimentitalea psychrophila]|uniref:IS3 family transposase n=1 Tax=Parasedimentitalea psychrophila TaxID=2997337 RepID=UPI0028BF5993|nr:IS3 family transposase [Parasedimentitalea psychrophila]
MQCPAGQRTNKHSSVTAHKAQYAVSTLCRHLKISRGWFYGFLTSQDTRDQRLVIREARDLELLPKIKAFFKASGKCYGSKRIHQDLMADGEIASERRVAIIMKENKESPLLRKRRKPKTTDSKHDMKPSPNLLEQKFNCQTPNTVWLADITYIDTPSRALLRNTLPGSGQGEPVCRWEIPQADWQGLHHPIPSRACEHALPGTA